MKAAISIPDSGRLTPPRQHFIRAIYAAAMQCATRRDLENFIRPDDQATPILLRADATIGKTTVSGWGAEVASQALRDYLASLTAYSGASRLIARGVQGALGSAETASYPIRTGGTPATNWVEESSPIPVRSEQFSEVTVGPRKKIGSIVVFTREMLKRSDARSIVELAVAEDFAAQLDSAYFSSDAISDARHPGLLDGVTALSVPAVSGAAAIRENLAALAAAVSTGGSGEVTYITTPELLATMRVADPQVFAAVDIAASAVIPAGRVIAADPLAIIHAADTAPDIFAAEDALVHMSDVPLEIVSGTGPTTADPVREIWQTACIAVRTLADIAFSKRRSNAVAFIESATWS